MQWLADNIGSIVVCLAVFAVIAAIACFRIKQKKQGKTGCGCGCEGCAMRGACHSSKGDSDKKDE